MKYLFLLFLSINASAGWRKLGPGGGQGLDKQSCEKQFGAPCVEEAGPPPKQVEDDSALIFNKEGKLQVDQAILDAQIAAKAAAVEAKLQAEKLRLADIQRLKEITDSGKLTEAEKDEALKLALQILLENKRKETDTVATIEADPVVVPRLEPDPIIKPPVNAAPADAINLKVSK